MANRTVAVQLKAEIGQYVAGMSKASAATMRVGESARDSQAQASKHFDLAGKGALIMGGAMVAGLGMAIGKTMEFDKSMSAISAATGASGAALEQFRTAAMKAGADSQYSATEAAGAITEMAKAGVSAKDILGGGLTGALNLAAAGQLEVADAAGIASVAMTQFGLTGAELPHVADLLAAGAGKAMGSVGDLGAALNQAGLIASAAGLSIEETTGGLAAFASAGLIGSDAGTSFKTMLQALQAPSGKSAELMAELGLNMYDAQGNMLGLSAMAGQLQTHLGGLTEEQRNSALATIFGSDAVRAANVLYKEGAAGITEWTGKVNDAGYAQEQAAALTDNLSGDIERLGGSFDTLMISMGSGSQGPLREFVQLLTSLMDGIGMLVGAFNSLPGPVGAALIAFGLLAAFKGPLSGLFETISTKALSMKDSLAGAVTSTTGLKSAMSSVAGAFTPMTMGITSATLLLPPLIDLVKNLTGNSDSAAAGQKALADALRATNGVMDENSRKAAQQQLISEGLVDVLNRAGVSGRDAIDGLLGNADAQDRVNEGLQNYITTTMRAEGPVNTTSAAVSDAQIKYRQLAEALGMSKEEAEFFAGAAVGAASGTTGMGTAAAGAAPQIEAATEAQIALGESLAAFVDPLGTYTGLLQQKAQAEADAANKTAEKTGASSKSWQDFKDSVHVTFDEYMADLQAQVDAQTNWQTNMLLLAGRVSSGTLAELSRMGPEGAPLVADLVNRSDAELDKFDDITAQRSKEATDAWGVQLSQAAPVLAAIGKTAGAGVVAQLVAQLQAGTTTVGQIAAQYGVNLAGGINPVLTALGRSPVTIDKVIARNERYIGGYTGDGGKFEPKGIVHGGEFVLTKEQTAKAGVGNLYDYARSLDGYAGGGYVSAASVPKPSSTSPYGAPISTAGDATMQKEYDEVTAFMTANAGGILGGGALGGAWGSIWQYVKARIPEARMNSTYRPGDPGYHGRGKAIDFGYGSGPGGAGSAGLASINRLLHDGVGKNLAELIYDGIGDDRPDLKNGKPLTYNAATRAEHRNHVHAAVYDQGGPLYPGYTLAYNGTGKTEWVSKEVSGGGSGGGSGGSSSGAPATFVGDLYLDSGEFLGKVRGEAQAVVAGALTGVSGRRRYNG